MKYNKPVIEITDPQDVVTTSPEVETGRIPFNLGLDESAINKSCAIDEAFNQEQ